MRLKIVRSLGFAFAIGCTKTSFAPTTPQPVQKAPEKTEIPAGVTPAERPSEGSSGSVNGMVPDGVTPDDGAKQPPNGATPPPSGVTPPAANPPGVTPPATSPPGVTPSGFQFPAACLTNQLDSHHVTDNGYIMKLTDAAGKVIAAAPMGMSAITRGFSCSAESMAACYVLDVPLSFTAAQLPAGESSGSLSLCRAKDQSAKPEDATCESLLNAHGEKSGTTWRRTWEYLDLAVKFTVDGNNTIKVTDYAGMPGDPSGENMLLVFHPAFAFAAPGACQKDFLSPLVLDMDGDGSLSLTSAWDESVDVRFDWRADGKKVRSGWVAANDAFLVLGDDVRDGRALFGEFSRKVADPAATGKSFANGFQALAQYDMNGDGRVDGKDAVFGQLRIWRDLNKDGASQPMELTALGDAGIAAFELAYAKVANAPQKVAGNELWYSASYIKKDGSRHLIGDVWFNQRHGVEVARRAK